MDGSLLDRPHISEFMGMKGTYSVLSSEKDRLRNSIYHLAPLLPVMSVKQHLCTYVQGDHWHSSKCQRWLTADDRIWWCGVVLSV